MRFEVSGKLSPRYIGPYEILERMRNLAYRFALPPSLSRVHNIFHVSQLRKYMSDPSHVIQDQSIEIKSDLTYEQVPLRIVDHKEQQLQHRTIPYVKVQWSNQTVREVTWELEEEVKKNYPHFFEQGK
ncbi:hypothetical protein ACH5RR_037110 [Cinchona calisaya]|uniref:Chromo domain-containing protein n=1 Tax=Cinchona calisaya TaxID=153742 RepID=A0ABD2Y7H2_9GENT